MGKVNSTKVKKVESTRHHTKHPQLSVIVSKIEALNEDIEIKLLWLGVTSSRQQYRVQAAVQAAIVESKPRQRLRQGLTNWRRDKNARKLSPKGGLGGWGMCKGVSENVEKKESP